MENLERVRAIFDEAVELSGSARQDYLDRATAGEPELRRRVERLLASAEKEDDFLASPTAAPGHGAARAIAETPGMLIGPYKLLQLIGEGGFGSVWMAEQQSPVIRRVALKVIKLGMDTKQVIARFEAERQALAIMDHSSIARVFDAGATETGRPYFVMELVSGEPITAYSDAHNLTIRQRLELFTQVCQAVQYAHTKGIIHRDLKPSNVLVSTQDGRPLAKVIDFGIAKATASRLTEKTVFTEHRQFIGTPEYMSPEQADGSLDVDTRSDVYALGVLLYELLAGGPPFDARTLRSAGHAEIQRMIRELDPPRPSTRLGQASEKLASIAMQRQTEPAKIRNLIRGDLDWIVMKALEKDRQRRYDTASALALDVQRHLAGEPVLAAPPSAAYRVAKFVKRHKAPVTAAALVALTLVLGTAGTSVGLVVANQQRRLAQENEHKAGEEASRAQREAQRAQEAEAEAERRAGELEQVAEFQARMLDQIDATEAGGALVADVRHRLLEAIAETDLAPEERERQISTVDEYLQQLNATDAAATMIDRTILQPARAAIEQFGDQPLVKASLLHTLADVYCALGRYDIALPLQEQALKNCIETVGDDHHYTINVRLDLGRTLLERGESAEAEKQLTRTLESSRRVLGDEHPLTVSSLIAMGAMLRQRGSLTEAEPYLVNAAQVAERMTPPSPHLICWAFQQLSVLLSASGRPEEAEAMMREALSVAEAFSDQDWRRASKLMSDLGLLLRKQQRLAEAEPLYREAMERHQALLGEDHPQTVQDLNNLGELLVELRRYDDADPVVREALARSRRVHGDSHPQTILTLNNMGNLLMDQGRLAGAEPYLREALEHARGSTGRARPVLPLALISYGNLLRKQGRSVEAETHYREALATGKTLLGDSHPYTVTALIRLGGFLLEQRRLEEAESLLSQAYARSRSLYGDKHPDTLHALDALAAVSWRRGKMEAAKRFCIQALQGRRELLGESHRDTIRSRIGLATLLCDQQHYAEAEVHARETVSTATDALGPERDETLLASAVLAAALEGQRKVEQAEPLRRAVFDARHRQNGPKHADTLEAARALGKNLLLQQQAEGAEPFLRMGLEGYRELSASGLAADCQLLLGRSLAQQQRWREAETELTAAEKSAAYTSLSWRRQSVQALVDLYSAWDVSEPGRGFDQRASEWEAALQQLATTRPQN